MKITFLIRGVALTLVILCSQVFVLGAQNIVEFEIVLFGNRLWVFNSITQELTPVLSPVPLDRFADPDTNISPQKRHLISWNRFPQLLEGGFLLSTLDEPITEHNFSIDSNIELHFAEDQWPLGERFVVVQAGIVTEGEVEYPNPMWMLNTNAWLIDTIQQTIRSWSSDCNTLILIDESISDIREFAVQCSANLPPLTLETNFLTADGAVMTVDEPYHTLYTRTQRYEIGWVFTPNMEQVAVVNHHTEGPARDEVLIYRLDGSSEWITTFDTQTQPVIDLFWSPSGRYLAIQTSCFDLTISDCTQIRDVYTNEVIWESGRLEETISGTRYFSTTSIYWLADESEFLILGHFINESSASYIWHVSLNNNAPLTRWEIPQSINTIVDVRIQ